MYRFLCWYIWGHFNMAQLSMLWYLGHCYMAQLSMLGYLGHFDIAQLIYLKSYSISTADSISIIYCACQSFEKPNNTCQLQLTAMQTGQSKHLYCHSPDLKISIKLGRLLGILELKFSTWSCGICQFTTRWHQGWPWTWLVNLYNLSVPQSICMCTFLYSDCHISLCRDV